MFWSYIEASKDQKKRRVQIHSDLVSMSLLHYVVKMETRTHSTFPELKTTRAQEKLVNKWESWWSSYIRKKLGITRIPQPFHGLRHTFVEHGRASKMETDLRNLIEGPAPNTIDFEHYLGKLVPAWAFVRKDREVEV